MTIGHSKNRQKIPVTRDEHIAFLEAQYALFPNLDTLNSLELHRKLKAEGVPFIMVYGEPGETQEQRIQRMLKRRAEVLQAAKAEDEEEKDDPDE